MSVSFTSAALLLLCFVSTSCFPSQKECADAQSSSTQLLSIARTITTQTGSKLKVNPVHPIDWMEAKDMCDPTSLKTTSVPCIEKMLRVLGSYRAEVAWLAEFKSCSEFSTKLTPAMKKLQEDMSKCLKTREWTGPSNDSSINRARTTKAWEAELLCHYTMQRLYSFSIFTARVFAMGDPANHGSSESATLCSTTG